METGATVCNGEERDSGHLDKVFTQLNYYCLDKYLLIKQIFERQLLEFERANEVSGEIKET